MAPVAFRAALCALVGVGLCAALFRDEGSSLSFVPVVPDEARTVSHYIHTCTHPAGYGIT